MRRDGFTLLELSMVLVIIALIVGGIAVGNSLIRNAEIQSVFSDSQRFITSIKTFQDKYSALPGDFANATGNWTASGSCPTASISGTCSGNGDGLISGTEQFYAWQHLSLAKLVDGTFTGAAGGNGSSDRVPGTNIPSSQIKGSGWGLIYATGSSYVLNMTNDTLPAHVLWFGGRSKTGLTDEQNPILTSEEADQIDHKIDDGIPNSGKIVAQDNSATDCHSVSSGAYSYDLATGGLICALVFKTGY